MKAKATYETQDNDTFFGFAASLHYNDDAIVDSLLEEGYTVEAEEESDEEGYEFVVWIFSDEAPTKAIFMEELRADIKRVLQQLTNTK